MNEPANLDLLLRLTGSFEALRRGMEDKPSTWLLILLKVAQRPGCTITWLAENVGLTPTVVSRALQELGSGPERGKLDLIDTVADPINTKRNIYLLTENGRARIEELLSIAAGSTIEYPVVTAASYCAATAPNPATAASNIAIHVRTDQFSQSQLTRIKAAASKRFSNFIGENLVAFPLRPAEALIGPQQGANGESYNGLSGWVEQRGGRWFEMPTIYPLEGGVALADFDDPNDAFHFVLTWRGRHER